MSELVGEAIVELRGDDKRLARDIKKAGTDGGRSFSKGFDDETKKGIGKSFKDAVLSAGSRVTSVLNIAGVVGPAILAIGSAASAATAGVTALVGTLGPAAVAGAVAYAGALGAIVSAAKVSAFAFGGLSDALKANAADLAKLPPVVQKMVGTLKTAQKGVTAVRTSVQQGLFPGVETAVSRLGSTYFPILARQGKALGQTLGGLAVQGAKMASSGPFRKDFGTIARTNTTNVGLFGRAGLQLVDALRSLLVVAAPLTTQFAKFALGAASSVNQMVQAGRASGGLAAFFTKAGTVGAQLARILGNVAVAVFNIFKEGAASSGTGLLSTLELITAQFRAWTTSTKGLASLDTFFRQGQVNLKAMGSLIGAVVKGFSGLGSGKQLAPLLNQIKTQLLPPLLELLHNASDSGALSALVTALSSLTGVLGTLAGTNSSLTTFANTLTAIGDAASWVLKHVPGASTALGVLFAALGGAGALKLVGLGPLVTAAGTALGALATKMLIAAGASTTEAGAVTLSTLAHDAQMSTLGTWIGVKAIEFAAWVRTTAATVASTAVTLAASAATKVAAAAQWLLNAAMDANPIGLVIIAIAALVAGFILLYTHSATVRAIVTAVFTAIKTVVVGAVSFVVNFVKAHWQLLLAIITGPLGLIVLAVVRNWSRITSATSAAFNAVRNIVRSVWNAITGVIRAGVAAARAVVSSGFGALRSVISGAMNAAKAVVTAAWAAIKGAFTRGVSAVAGVARTLVAKIKGAFSGAKTLLLTIGGQIVAGLVHGISAAAGRVASAVRSIIDKIPGPIRKIMGIASPSKVMAVIGSQIVAGLVKGLTGKGLDDVDTALGKLTDSLSNYYDKRIKNGKAAAAATKAAIASLTDETKAVRLNAAARDRLTDALQAAKDAGANVTSNILQSLDLTAVSGTATDPGSILAGLQAQETALAAFKANLAKLRTEGLDKNLVADLAAKGVDQAGAYVTSLSTASAAQIAAINASATNIRRLATQTGADATAGLAAGITSQLAAVDKAGKTLAEALLKAVKKHLKIKSPSRVMAEQGRQVAAGMAQGILAGMPDVTSAARKLAATAIPVPTTTTPGVVNLPTGGTSSGGGTVGGTGLGPAPKQLTQHIYLPTGDPEAAASAVWSRWVLEGVGG